ncbi:beta-aspartyl-peptidase [Clostridium oryzae]|uniref:Isoaspartyl dipeptidase n=1 Tax=Clostridium oryzae TaxID=1450648 RepID=A0A1V4IMY8_9CLOT|nr:beta-aspartyl-peptidase [Clostridium oryzae]OPJ61418.1 isoaspartyl dipeptidase [Clostridium oryzae]
MIVIKNGEVYSPERIGKKNIVLEGTRIEGIYDEINVPNDFINIDMIDAEDKLILPGFIDSHVHITGGGGEDGFSSRTPEIQLSTIIKAGITTIVGCLGADSVCRNMTDLLAKAYALEEEGVTTYIYTGSYEVPVKSLTDSLDKDIILIEKIIGAGEIAVADNRSSQPTYDEFVRTVAKSRVAGLISGKAGVVNVHVGNSKEGIEYIFNMIRNTDIPITQIIPTHMNRSKRLLMSGVELGKLDGIIDLTTSCDKDCMADDELTASEALKMLLDNDVNIENIQFTSDAQGSLPAFDEKGRLIKTSIGSVESLYDEVRNAISNQGIKLEEAIKVITSNVAEHLKFKKKGRLAKDYDADLVIIDKNSMEITDVIAKGKVAMRNGKVLMKGTYENK